MSNEEEEPPATTATDILTHLLAADNGTSSSPAANSAAISTSGENTQVGEAQQAALLQIFQQLQMEGGLPLPEAAAGAGESDQEKKHAFWDTQVS